MGKGATRTKFLNQTQKNQPQKKMIISKDKVAYGNQQQMMFSPLGQNGGG